jgi:hypothetical protein
VTAAADVAEHVGPELRCAVQITAVEHDNEVTAEIGLGIAAHCPSWQRDGPT